MACKRQPSGVVFFFFFSSVIIIVFLSRVFPSDNFFKNAPIFAAPHTLHFLAALVVRGVLYELVFFWTFLQSLVAVKKLVPEKRVETVNFTGNEFHNSFKNKPKYLKFLHVVKLGIDTCYVQFLQFFNQISAYYRPLKIFWFFVVFVWWNSIQAWKQLFVLVRLKEINNFKSQSFFIAVIRSRKIFACSSSVR